MRVRFPGSNDLAAGDLVTIINSHRRTVRHLITLTVNTMNIMNNKLARSGHDYIVAVLLSN